MIAHNIIQYDYVFIISTTFIKTGNTKTSNIYKVINLNTGFKQSLKPDYFFHWISEKVKCGLQHKNTDKLIAGYADFKLHKIIII